MPSIAARPTPPVAHWITRGFTCGPPEPCGIARRVRARAFLALALLALVARGEAARAAGDLDAADARAQREWARTIGLLGYVYGAPLLELAVAEYRQTQGLASDLRARRG